jgi:hypothetical protein
VNASEASFIASIFTECQLELATLSATATATATATAPVTSIATSIASSTPNPTATGTAQCGSQCGLIEVAASSCADDICFCPTLLAEGPQCTQCWLSVNVTEASFIASIYSECQTELNSSGTSQSSKATQTSSTSSKPTGTGTGTATAASTATVATTSRSSDAVPLSMIGIGYMQVFMVLSMAAGFVGVFF